MSLSFIECPKCKELASIQKSSMTTVIHCKCSTVELDTMVEEDRHYHMYNNFMEKYGNTISPVYNSEDTI